MKLREWVEVIDTFIKLGRGDPRKIALAPETQLRPALVRPPEALQAPHLWTADTLAFADLSPATFHALKRASGNAENSRSV